MTSTTRFEPRRARSSASRARGLRRCVRARVAVPTFSSIALLVSQTQRALSDASRTTSTAVANACEPSGDDEQWAFKRAKKSLDLAAQVSERARTDEDAEFDQARINVVRDKMNTIVTDLRERVDVNVRAVEVRAREAMDEEDS